MPVAASLAIIGGSVLSLVFRRNAAAGAVISPAPLIPPVLSFFQSSSFFCIAQLTQELIFASSAISARK
jgi:hypothetical protein